MADSPNLPGERAWRVGPDGKLPLEFWKFLRDLVGYVRQTQGNSDDLSEIDSRLDALEQASALTIVGPASVQVAQQDARAIVRLLGDVISPGASSYYGTDVSGARGWYQRLLSTLADVDITTPPEAGDALVYDGTVWKPGTIDTAVPFFVPDGQSYTVVANKQALFTLPIELDGDASLVLDGALVEVS